MTGFGDSIDAAIKKAYMGLSSIHFEGAQFRSDIGASSDPGLTNSSSLG